jgi:nucleoside-diphosphate-sugar epimerase
MQEYPLGPRSIDHLHAMASRPSRAVVEFLSKLDGDVMIIGAGGKMGFHLANMLRRGMDQAGAKNRLVAVSRFGDSSATRIFHDHGIETISCDLTVEEQLAALPPAENIYFLAGVKFGTSEDVALLQRMNVDLPARVARKYKNSRIVALSTGCVYRFVNPNSGGSVEADDPAPVGAYAQSCLGRELAFRNSRASCSLIRLNYSVDLRYGVLVDVAQKVLAGHPVDVTMGYANVIWQGDACAHIILSMSRASQPPFVLNVTGSQILSIRKVAQRFGELFRKPVSIVGVESPTAWLNNARLAHALFGKPAIDEDTLMHWVADWLLAGGETLGKPTHFEVRDGKY